MTTETSTRRKRQRPALVRRLSLPWGRAKESWPPLRCEVAATDYPELAEPIAVIEKVLIEEFTKLDETAGRQQRSHRGLQVILLLGAAIATTFGAVQAAFSDQRWPGIAVAVVGFLTVAINEIVAQTRPLEHYIHTRARAEQLRSLTWMYLADPEMSERDLEAEVSRIVYEPVGQQ